MSKLEITSDVAGSMTSAEAPASDVTTRQPRARASSRTLGTLSLVEGIKTTVPLQLRILAEPDFVAGRLGTGFMDRFLAKPRPASLAEAV